MGLRVVRAGAFSGSFQGSAPTDGFLLAKRSHNINRLLKWKLIVATSRELKPDRQNTWAEILRNSVADVLWEADIADETTWLRE